MNDVVRFPTVFCRPLRPLSLTRLRPPHLPVYLLTHSPVRSLTWDSAVSHLLTPNSSGRILMYTYSSSFFFNLNLPHTHTTYFISSVLYNITHCILYPSSSSSSSSHIFLYAIPKSVAMENFFSFLFSFFLFSVLFVSSRLVFARLVSLFRFILTHAYYSTSFVVSARNVDLAWTFFCLYCNILYI